MSSELIQLLTRLRAGDEEAAVELVRRYELAIRVAIRTNLSDPRLRRQFDSLDVCQSVFASFFKNAAAGAWTFCPSCTQGATQVREPLVSGVSAIDPTARTVSTGFTISIFAIDLDPNPLKSLVRVTLVDRGGDPSQYAFETVLFYGATGW